MSILVATDGASPQDPAVECGIALGRKLKRHVAILRVFDEAPDQQERERFAHAVSRWAEAGGYPASTHVASGEEDAAIVQEARDIAADVIVLGPHRSSLLDDLFGKSMVEDVVEDTDRMVLVAGTRRHDFERILVLIDCSDASAGAVLAAHKLFPHEPINFVRAWHVPYEGFLSSDQSHEDLQLLAVRETKEFLAKVQRDSGSEGVAMGELLIREGETVSVVNECISELDADLLVIDIEGKPRLLTSALDPTARCFLEDPPCDVLAVQRGSTGS